MIEKLASLLILRAEADRAGFKEEVQKANLQLFPLMGMAQEGEVEAALHWAAYVLSGQAHPHRLCAVVL